MHYGTAGGVFLEDDKQKIIIDMMYPMFAQGKKKLFQAIYVSLH